MEKKTITRAEKKDAVKNLIRELLSTKGYKHNELLDEVSALYVSRYEGSDNINDVKGRVGSILDVMKKEGDVMEDGGAYMLKARFPMPEPAAEKPTKKPRAKKSEKAVEQTPATPETEKPPVAEKPVKKPRAKKEKTDPVAPALPIAPIAPVIPVTPETAPEPVEEKPAKKTRSKKTAEPKTETAEKTDEPVKKTRAKKTKPQAVEADGTAEKKEEKQEEKKEDKKEEKRDEPTVIPENEPVIVPTPIPAPVSEPTPTPAPVQEPAPAPTVKAETETERKEETKPEPKAVAPVFDMTALFADPKAVQKPVAVEPKKELRKEPKQELQKEPETKSEVPEKAEKEGGRVEPKPVLQAEQPKKENPKPTPKTAQKPEPKKAEQSVAQKQEPPVATTPAVRGNVRRLSQAKPTKPLTADEALREAFLKKLRSLGGDYFEYYSVYLLERYSLRNGRRLESLRISGGDHDGGIDGEIELTDKFGFKETIYIQAKNWNPDKGNESLWVVGETLLQQFLGACAYRQAKDGKQHSRGIFITTSRFTPEAKRMLDELSDKLVGYDGNDLYEAAKECSFGLIQKNGNWVLDEKLLSGEKAFFNLF